MHMALYNEVYLHSRFFLHKLSCNNILSGAMLWEFGVTQESILSPILFIIHIYIYIYICIYCNKRRGLIYADFIVGMVQQIFSYQLSGINCKYHAYAIILLPVIA